MIDAREEVLAATAAPLRRDATRKPGPARAPQRSKSRRSRAPLKPLPVERVFSDARTSPWDQVEWETRVAEITDDAGKAIFKQDNVGVPKFWSQLATKVVVSKYFYGEQNTPEREVSVQQLIQLLHRGPPSAQVAQVSVEEATPEGSERFEVRH